MPRNREFTAAELALSLATSEDGVAASLERTAAHCVAEFGCLAAFITALDDETQHVLACSGCDGSGQYGEFVLCRHALDHADTFTIADASKDERFCKDPAVAHEPRIRSYLGVPIRDPDGDFIGTVSLIDPRPDYFSQRQTATLANHARGVEDLLRLHHLNNEARRSSAVIKHANDRLADTNRMFGEAEKAAGFGAWQLDIETRELTWSDGVYHIHGLDPSQPVTLEQAFSFYHEDERDTVRNIVETAIASGEPFEISANIVASDGLLKRVRSRGKTLSASEAFPARLTGVFKDVTEHYQSEVALRHAAEHDSLTELYNRYAFDRLLRGRLSRAKSSESSVFLLLIDLDGFKDVNDTLGHLVGDVVLEETGRRIAEAAAEGCVTARWGGDEFAMVLPERITCQQAIEMGTAILQVIGQRIEVGGRSIDISATAGLVDGTCGVNAKEMVRQADTALFHGKKREPGGVHVYNEVFERENLARQRAIYEVRSAIEHQRLYAGYQPVIDLRTGKTVGFEALMRLNTSDGRQLTASEVLPALLDTRVSREVCRSMLTMISGEAVRLEACVPGFSFLSINASEADLLSQNFVERFTETMESAGVNLSRLTLEVTETVLLVDNSQPVQQVLRRLHERGVGIALDDFGTGYSSLSHLREFPIDKVKIDRSFVRALSYEHQSRTIVQALIGMARSMEIEVIAEGIETETQRNILRQMDCGFGQGYLFGAAEDIGRLELNLLNNKPEEEQQQVSTAA